MSYWSLCLVPLPEATIAGTHMNFVADVVVVGHPPGFHDEMNNLPIDRQGMIASPYPHSQASVQQPGIGTGLSVLNLV